MAGGAVFLTLILSVVATTSDDASLGGKPAEEGTGADCGISALYNLSRLAGRPLEWDAIRSGLPRDRVGHFSMKELSDAALRAGLRLQGVLLDRKEERAIDRPMLVFLNRGQHGHFLVVRPIGHTGKLVQVIDSIEPPAVMDRSQLLAAPSWTGLALIPEKSEWGILALRIATGSALLLALTWNLARRFGRKHSTQSDLGQRLGGVAEAG